MEKIKLEIEIIKTLLNYISIVLFGTGSYLFINYESLKLIKVFLLGYTALFSLVAVSVCLYFYFKAYKEI